MSVEDHLLVLNNVLFTLKRFETWTEAMEEKLQMVTMMRRTFDEVWNRPEYKTEAERITKEAYQHLDCGDFEAAQQCIEKLQELYTMNKMYENLE